LYNKLGVQNKLGFTNPKNEACTTKLFFVVANFGYYLVRKKLEKKLFFQQFLSYFGGSLLKNKIIIKRRKHHHLLINKKKLYSEYNIISEFYFLLKNIVFV